MKIIIIYVYGQHCVRAGDIAFVDSPQNDVNLWGKGTRNTLIAKAIKSLSRRNDFRASGNGDDYRWRCDRRVLEFLGGPAVDFNSETGFWEPQSPEE